MSQSAFGSLLFINYLSDYYSQISCCYSLTSFYNTFFLLSSPRPRVPPTDDLGAPWGRGCPLARQS
jgi:hypothetical protein